MKPIENQFPPAGVSPHSPRPTSWPWLFMALGCGLTAHLASAQSVVITDLTEAPITAVVAGSLNPGDNKTITADKTTPEKVSFSIAADGRGGGTGVAVLLDADRKTVSDILEVTTTQGFRGRNADIPYLNISGTFTSDGDPGGLDLSTLGLTDAIMKMVLQAGLVEDGTQQNLGAQLLDTTTGNAFSIGGLSLTAASDVPEPSSVLFCSALLGGWVVAQRIRRGRAQAGSAV